VLSHLILKIKSFVKYFQKGVLKYFKIFMKFLDISKWNISSCISTCNVQYRVHESPRFQRQTVRVEVRTGVIVKNYGIL